MTPAPQINIPNLDGLGLPKALLDAVRQAFMYLQSLFSSVRSLQNTNATGVATYLQKNIPANAPVGTKIWVSDYQHCLVFGTYTWQFAPGDGGSDYFRDCSHAPGAGSGLWHACDGSTVSYLKSDGTLGTVTLPNTGVAAQYGRQGPAYAPGLVAATAPVFNGTPGNTGTPSGGQSETITGPSTVATNTHTHAFTPAGTVDVSGGDPVAHYTVLRYYRQ